MNFLKLMDNIDPHNSHNDEANINHSNHYSITSKCK